MNVLSEEAARKLLREYTGYELRVLFFLFDVLMSLSKKNTKSHNLISD